MTKRYIPYLAILTIIAIIAIFVYSTRSSTARTDKTLTKQKVVRVKTAPVGDCNQDGKVDVDDLLLLLDVLQEGGPKPDVKIVRDKPLGIGSSDVNDDGVIDESDLREILILLNRSKETQRAKPVQEEKVVKSDKEITIVYPKQKDIVLTKSAKDRVLQGLFVRGDANSDGYITLDDSIYIMSYIKDPNSVKVKCEDALDVDDNGEPNIDDAIYLLNFQVAAGPQPLLPFPEPGIDPTPDNLDCPTKP
ncbi:MAG: dockerin type I domain-containing protein [Pseudomonadota bacterium]